MPTINFSYGRGTCAKAIAAFVILIATACNTSTDPTAETRPPELTTLPRALSTGEIQVRDASNNFSFALLSKVTTAAPNDNVFISPLSASLALGMTMNGAANSTFTEMRSALQFGTLSQAEINASYKSLVGLLLSLDASTKLTIANSIWYRNTVSFRQSFFDSTAKYFAATAKGLNFEEKVASLASINGWANTATNGRIPEVLTDISPNSVMFLLNAIYFKGTWRDKFDAAQTAVLPFTPVTGVQQTARLMHREGNISYAETPTYQAVDVPYGNTAFSMTVILPKAGTDVNGVSAAMTSSALRTLTASLLPRPVDLWLPKVKLEYVRTLNDDLKALGMQAAFSPDNADFSNMAADGGLFISFVKQNTFVDVNEEGTEAAAVTTVGVELTSAPVRTVVRVDRPFMFVIREHLSGTVLFVGKISRMP